MVLSHAGYLHVKVSFRHVPIISLLNTHIYILQNILTIEKSIRNINSHVPPTQFYEISTLYHIYFRPPKSHTIETPLAPHESHFPQVTTLLNLLFIIPMHAILLLQMY